MTDIVRLVDLFSGCGGMSLGFELYTGPTRYETVLALDNNPLPVRCHNANFPNRRGGLPTSRICDVTWFSHPSEILLFYLTHLALWQPDAELLAALEAPNFGLRAFLSQLRSIDEHYTRDLSVLTQSKSYQIALSAVDPRTFTTAICRTFIDKLGLNSLRTADLIPTAIPWREEYCHLTPVASDGGPESSSLPIPSISAGLQRQWDDEVTKLDEASGKEGRGQNKVVAKRTQTLVEFLGSEAGTRLRDLWINWRAQRDSVRAYHCTAIQSALSALYTDERRVHLVLGGPPCKGFSRIGRAVIESLRDQGVHAWSSHEYGDERNALMHKYVLFLEALQPDVFLFENVAQFTSALRTPAGRLNAVDLLSEAIEELSDRSLHYDIKAQIVRAREYGVPQDRIRFIMIGCNIAATPELSSAQFFKMQKYTTEVPLQLALQGLEMPGVFAPGDPTASKPNLLTRAYTLVDPAMPDTHRRYINWIRQNAPGKEQSPDYTDAHIVRRLRSDDLALIQKFAPGQRWMDYKLKQSRTLADLRNVLEAVLQYIQHQPQPTLPNVDTLMDLLERVDEGLLLRLMLEGVAISPTDNPADDEQPKNEHHLLSYNYLKKGTDKHGDWLERLAADRPCKTIVAHIGKDTYGYIHPYLDRAISIREAARVQTFPDFFSFGSVGVVDGYAMIGNAVPPLLSNLFAEQLANIHENLGLFGRPQMAEIVRIRPKKVEQIKLDLDELDPASVTTD